MSHRCQIKILQAQRFQINAKLIDCFNGFKISSAKAYTLTIMSDEVASLILSTADENIQPEQTLQSITPSIINSKPVDEEHNDKPNIERTTTAEPLTQPVQKVQIVLKPVGGEVPALEKQKYKLDGAKAIVEVERFLKKKLSLEDKTIYLFCGQGFSPTPDQILQDLYDCFHCDKELVISYGVQEVWG